MGVLDFLSKMKDGNVGQVGQDYFPAAERGAATVNAPAVRPVSAAANLPATADELPAEVR